MRFKNNKSTQKNTSSDEERAKKKEKISSVGNATIKEASRSTDPPTRQIKEPRKDQKSSTFEQWGGGTGKFSPRTESFPGREENRPLESGGYSTDSLNKMGGTPAGVVAKGIRPEK